LEVSKYLGFYPDISDIDMPFLKWPKVFFTI
jgi:hypothetical protein